MRGSTDGLEAATATWCADGAGSRAGRHARLRLGNSRRQAVDQAEAVFGEVPDSAGKRVRREPRSSTSAASQSDFKKRKRRAREAGTGKAREGPQGAAKARLHGVQRRRVQALPVRGVQVRPCAGRHGRLRARVGPRDTNAGSRTARATTSKGVNVMDHVLVILGLLLLWALFLLVSPTRACGSCDRHRGPCPRCKGTGRRFRPGARLVHRGAVQAHKQRRRG